MLLDNPGTGAVDDLEALRLGADMTSGVTPWARITTAAPLIDIVERVDRLNALRLELRDHAFVVNDLPEGVCRFALCGGETRIVGSLAHSVEKPVRRAMRTSSTDPITDQVWSNPMADALDYLCRVCGERTCLPCGPRVTARRDAARDTRSFDYLECPACGAIQIKDNPTDLARYAQAYRHVARGQDRWAGCSERSAVRTSGRRAGTSSAG